MSQENTEKYKNLSIPIEKEVTKVDKEVNENIITISYKIKLTDSVRFMASSLSNLVDNLAEGIHRIKLKDCDSFLDCDCFLEHESFKDKLIE